MKSQQKPSQNFVQRRIQVLDAWLRGELPGSRWTAEDVRRIAFHRVYAEDVEQQDPMPVTDPILKAAMERWRAKHILDEPDYPKGARERYQKQKERENQNDFFSKLLRKAAKQLTPEQQERIDAFKDELTETVDLILNEDCDDADLELSEHESTAISDQMGRYIDELLRKQVDDLEPEDSKDRIGEQVAEHVRELIQMRIDERWEGA